MAWDKNLPSGSASVSVGDDAIRANMDSLEDGIGQEHYFPENATAAKHGRHKLGRGTTTARDSAITSPDDGNVWFEEDSSGNPVALNLHNGTSWIRFGSALVGEVRLVAFDPTTPPAGWLQCNGQAVSRTTYAALFAKIGTVFGAGNGTTTFNVPDLRSRVPMGFHSGGDGDGDHDAIGETGGAKTNTLAEANLPELTHTVNDAGHVHDLEGYHGENSGTGGFGQRATSDTATAANPTDSATTGITVDPHGQATPDPVENRQLFIVLGYVIHAGV